MPDSIALKLENVSKKYTIGKTKDGSLRGTLGNLFKRKEEKEEEFWALKDISFEVGVGDVVGIIGKNGAGKSTLLKVLSQITKPTTGKIEINGRVASLLEVGTGFHPELTGRENIFLNGTILGMTRREVQAKFDEIVAFSGVEKFIDTPVKHYSSGMYVRLAFAVAAHLDPEILIIDEVLSVGDAEFQKKCLGKMKDVAGKGRTVLFVSHNMQAVNLLCNKGVVISKGNQTYTGDIKNAILNYNDLLIDNIKTWHGREGDEDAVLLNTRVYTEIGDEEFFNDNDIFIEITVEILKKVSNLVIGFHLYNEFDNPIAYVASGDYYEQNFEIGIKQVKFKIPKFTLSKGNYTIRINFGVHSIKHITKGIGDLSFFIINKGKIGCIYPVKDIYSFSGVFRPNWEII